MSREFDLLVACTRTAIGAPLDGRLSKMADAPLDWKRLLELADAHAVAPLVWTALKDACGVVPSEAADQLRQAAFAAAARNLILAGEMHRLLGWFGEQRIPAVPFKGPVLASAVYRNQGLRGFDDLDILVRKQDVTRARNLLCSRGYRAASCLDHPQETMRFHWNGQLTFAREDGLVHVDLHWELAPHHFPITFDLKRIWQDLSPVVVAGSEVLTLSPEDLVLYLCAHGSKHLWQRLVWVCDVACLIRTYRIHWGRVYAQARGSERMLSIGLLLARDLMGTEPQFYVPALAGRDGRTLVLASQIQRRLSSRSGSKAQTCEVFLFNWRAAGNIWLKLRYPLGLITLPAEADWSFIRLPVWLFFLHYPLRLTRLLVKYARRRTSRSEAAVPMS